MPKTHYEDFEVGDAASSPVSRTIGESDVYTQAGLSGSYNPLHVDREHMADTEFDGRLVQNTLLISVMEGLKRRLPWEPATIAAYGRDNVRFTAPVYIDDTVSLESEIADKRERDDDSGIVTFRETLTNQRDETVVVGDYLLLLPKRD